MSDYRKIIVQYDDSSRSIYDDNGAYLGLLTTGLEPKYFPLLDQLVTVKETIETKDDVVVQLVKLGVTVDELVKLRNSDLL